MEQKLKHLAETFSATPMLASREMRRLLESDRDLFRETTLGLMRGSQYQAGHQYALTLLVTNGLILDRLVDPAAFELSEAVEIGRRILTSIDTFVDVKMVRFMIPSGESPAVVSETPAMLRVLEIVGKISDGSRVMTLLTQLLHHSDVKVKAKVALLIGRINRNVGWVEHRMEDPDGRVRASAVESLWGMDTDMARQIFVTALSDPDNRVAGNAAVGLYRCGDLMAAEALEEMLVRGDLKSRATAAWAMGQLADLRFLPALSRALSEKEPSVRTRVFHAVADIRRRVKSCQEAGKLRVAITRRATTPGGKRLDVMIMRDGQRLARLMPTEIVVTDSSQVINCLTLNTRRETEDVVVGFVVPRGTVREDPMGQALLNGLGHFLEYKRKSDAWAATKYSVPVPKAAPQAVFRLEAALLSSGSGGARSHEIAVEEETTEALLPIRLTTNPEQVLAQCESVGLKTSAAESAQLGVRRMLEVLSLVTGHRTIFVFLSGLNNAGWDELSQRIFAAEITLHVIAINCPVDAALTRICEESGGSVISVTTPLEMDEACKSAALTLAGFYTIEYDRAANPQKHVLRVQVCSDLGFGEDQLVLQELSDVKVA